MKSYHYILFLFLLLFSTMFSQDKGHLVIIGGGDRYEAMMQKIVEFAGGDNSKIVVIPNASSEPIESGESMVREFKNLGCKDVIYLYCTRDNADADSNLAKLSGVTGIYFCGGDQSFLTRDLLNTKLLRKIKEIYHDGGVISGTSAGAAVMSEVMITGNELINKDSTSAFITIQKGNIETVEGFGFIKSGIIDQHFLKRKRHNRLITVVLEYPQLIGIAIDESTAIVVSLGRTFEVMGENQVIIYDATKAKNIRVDKNGNLGAENITMQILLSGNKYDLANREVIE